MGNLAAGTDTDSASCKKRRESTSGGMVMQGGHVSKSWSTNHTTLALPSVEAGYYGMVKVASQALGLRAVAEDIGVSFAGPMKTNTDASAAIGIGSRLGLGKVRQIEVNQG